MNGESASRQPLVSVIIPCYQQARFLPEAIDSALAQTYPHVEVIVINDGSTDNTSEVCRRYGKRVRYLEQENKGVCEARNAAIRAALGEYIVPLDGDDKLEPSYLAATVPPLRAEAGVGFVYTNVKYFGGSYGARGTVPGHRHWNLLDFLRYNVSTCTMLFRKTDWERVGGYCPQFVHGAEDWDLTLSLIELGKIGHYVDEPLFLYRHHHVASRNTRLMTEHLVEQYELILKRHHDLFAQHWEELLLEWAKLSEAQNRYIRKVEPWVEQRPGRLEQYGVPVPVARWLRRLRYRLANE